MSQACPDPVLPAPAAARLVQGPGPPAPPGRLQCRAAPCLLPVAAVLCVLASPIRAMDHVELEALWLEPVQPRPDIAAAAYTIPALLNLPPGWSQGDGAVILLTDDPWADPSQLGLVTALLDEETAVLELDPYAAHGLARDRPGWKQPGRESLALQWPDPSRPDHSQAGMGPAPDNGVTVPLPGPRDLLPDIFGALRVLRQEAGAGLIVAIGTGAAGEAALLATTEPVAATYLPEGGPRLTAAASLGPGPARFASGAPPERAEGWPGRVLRLCQLLAGVTTEAAAHPIEEAERCATALLPRPPGALAAGQP